MESSRESSVGLTPSSQGHINPNAKLTVELFNEKFYNDWAYLAELAPGGTQRLKYIDGIATKQSKSDSNYSKWKAENLPVID